MSTSSTPLRRSVHLHRGSSEGDWRSTYSPTAADRKRYRDFLQGSLVDPSRVTRVFSHWPLGRDEAHTQASTSQEPGRSHAPQLADSAHDRASHADAVNPQSGDFVEAEEAAVESPSPQDGGGAGHQASSSSFSSSSYAKFLFVKDEEVASRRAFVAHISNIIYSSAHEMVMVVLPHINQVVGGDVLTFSHLRSLANSLNLVGGVLIGAFSDVYGPKLALIISHASAAASFLLAGTATSVTGLYWSAVPLFAMHGFQATLHVVTLESEAEDRAKAQGRVGALYGIGFFGGSLILLGALHVLASRDIALLAGGMETLAVCFIAYAYPDGNAPSDETIAAEPADPDPTRSRLDTGFAAGVMQVLRQHGVIEILTYKMVMTMATGSVLYLSQQFAMTPFGFSASQAALLMSYLGGMQILSQALVTDAITPKSLYLVTTATISASLLGMGLSPVSSGMFVLWLAPLSVFFHAGNVMLGSLLTLYVPEEEMGTVLGLSIATMTVSQIVTVPAAAELFHLAGFSAVPLAASGFLLGSTVVIYGLGFVPPNIQLLENEGGNTVTVAPAAAQ